jgi:hypothetical protein
MKINQLIIFDDSKYNINIFYNEETLGCKSV